MTRVLSGAAFLVLGFWALVSFSAWAIGASVVPLPAAAPVGPTGPVLPVTLSPLEQQLFADAADGRLDEHSLLWAALVAGGVTDAAQIERDQRDVDALVERWRDLPATSGSPMRRARAVFELMHREVLRGGYRLDATNLTTVFEKGHFNCVSASVFYCYLAGRFGLDARGLELPGHAMSRLHVGDDTIDVESTCAEWFRLIGDPRRQAELAARTTGFRRDESRGWADGREVSGAALVATIYYNRGVDLLREKRFGQAVEANVKALWLDPSSATARGNLLATLNNWAIHEGASGCYNEAVGLLRSGLALESGFRPFHVNFIHVHRQWSESLCQQGRFEQSCAVLAAAQRELADERPWFDQALLDVYRRWVAALLVAEQIDRALTVLEAAGRVRGEDARAAQWEIDQIQHCAARLAERGRNEAALAVLDHALQRHPGNATLADRRRTILSERVGPTGSLDKLPEVLPGTDEHFISDTADETTSWGSEQETTW